MSAEPARGAEPLRIVVAADNAGVELKDRLRDLMRDDPRVAGVVDVGVSDAADDTAYPVPAAAAAEMIARGEADRGVLVCGTGIGVAIAANKVPGIRATVAHDSYSAERSIKSNDCQIITFGARVIGPHAAEKILTEWLGHRFDAASPSAAKVARITEYENEHAGAGAAGTGCG
ncbi:RpiB/LacA/LacB family sugar-phosphate isomerase [Nocardiopsis composta]|uniref:D-erythrulose 4-phosphate isomerase n=1 Tax=Nocardiopsis composta TaxID=157465 RepID=A0A7W8QGS2_9ACTN|nr:RpiB/LacA/LacB family sugar-phosphate isomerase [Nocardiopsis composta]MBB5429980.1 ribose 5-phosphate isomerase B [Nocardiopsis composta]